VATSSPPSVPVLHHVNLKTTRPEEMIQWYCTVLGMDVVHADAGGAWLSNDAANHRIALLTTPLLSDDPDKLEHTGMHHMAYEYATLDDLFAAFEYITETVGSEPHMCLDHGMTLSFYFVDPDGNSLELQADWWGDWARSKDFMASSPEFAADSIGPFVDPRKLIAAWREGTTPAELRSRSRGGEFPPEAVQSMRLPVAS
jgi:catechol 2,3-dioxygenase